MPNPEPDDDVGKTYENNFTKWLIEPLSSADIETYMWHANNIAEEHGLFKIEVGLTHKDGLQGIQFSSDDYVQFIQMLIAMFGDEPSARSVNVNFDVIGDPEAQIRWREDVVKFLGDHTIPFKYEFEGDNRHRFWFDRRLHGLFFYSAITSHDRAELASGPEKPASAPLIKNLGDLRPQPGT